MPNILERDAATIVVFVAFTAIAVMVSIMVVITTIDVHL